MNTNSKITEVVNHFKFGDWHLGFRRYLDLVLAANNLTVYQSGLDSCDAYDKIAFQKETNPDAWQNTIMPTITLIEQSQSDTKPNYNSLIATNISKKYKKGNFGLLPMDLTLGTGNITGLVGENGNGKTTLLRTLFGELEPETGTITYYFNNTDKGQAFNYEVKTKLAFIAQRPEPWYGPLSDNLQFAATHAGIKGKENYLWTQLIMERMGLRQFKTYNWKQISSGYKMRFELAKALISKPSILMLDEPLANLDVLAQQIILEDLKYLASSDSMPLSIILSSQQLYEVEKVAQQIVFLKNGKAIISQNQKLNTAIDAPQESHKIIELETNNTREELLEIFKPLGLEKISFNGGVYIMYFTPTTNNTQILETLASKQVSVNYFRDISTSARRLFDA
jgi:ABC-2 type transport system ATP-binding protein